MPSDRTSCQSPTANQFWLVRYLRVGREEILHAPNDQVRYERHISHMNAPCPPDSGVDPDLAHIGEIARVLGDVCTVRSKSDRAGVVILPFCSGSAAPDWML